ncbi:TPA: Na+/H+ antiporter NhaC family protein, partial [Clostridioides difficile]|nr:Na+/H+ antiporter NhaC family protein [Clostridioides difficile]
MRNKKINIIFLTTIMFIMSTVMVFAEEDIDTIALANAEKFGILTLIPPLVAIILAFITKNVIISLLIGILSGSFIIKASGINVFATFIQAFLDLVDRALVSLADPWNAGIILQVLAIGGVINLVAKMGGAKAIAEALAKRAKSAKGTQLIT